MEFSPQALNLFLLILVQLYYADSNDFPLAPLDVEMHCLTGFSSSSSPMFVKLCPLATTSCGMLEFWRESKVSGAIYECLDSSIFVSESEDQEAEKKYTYSKICDDQPKCRRLTLDLFNPVFLAYVNRSYPGLVSNSPQSSVRLCCAFDRDKLHNVVRDPKIGYFAVANKRTRPIKCHNVLCMPNAIGCIHYEQKNASSRIDDWDAYEYSDEESPLIPFEENGGFGCVYRHLNDEIYRYCLLIKRKHRQTGCFDGHNNRICCCFIENEQTCDPLRRHNSLRIAMPSGNDKKENVIVSAKKAKTALEKVVKDGAASWSIKNRSGDLIVFLALHWILLLL